MTERTSLPSKETDRAPVVAVYKSGRMVYDARWLLARIVADYKRAKLDAEGK